MKFHKFGCGGVPALRLSAGGGGQSLVDVEARAKVVSGFAGDHVVEVAQHKNDVLGASGLGPRSSFTYGDTYMFYLGIVEAKIVDIEYNYGCNTCIRMVILFLRARRG